MTKTNWNELVGQRCLVTDHVVYEATIMEVAPSGERVKILRAMGLDVDWVTPIDEGRLTLVEVL